MGFLIYLLIINIISGIVFYIDKQSAGVKGAPRTDETTLHLLEILGGIFAIIILLFAIRHKNRKKSYWIVSLLILLAWFFVIYGMLN